MLGNRFEFSWVQISQLDGADFRYSGQSWPGAGNWNLGWDGNRYVDSPGQGVRKSQDQTILRGRCGDDLCNGNRPPLTLPSYPFLDWRLNFLLALDDGNCINRILDTLYQERLRPESGLPELWSLGTSPQIHCDSSATDNHQHWIGTGSLCPLSIGNPWQKQELSNCPMGGNAVAACMQYHFRDPSTQYLPQCQHPMGSDCEDYLRQYCRCGQIRVLSVLSVTTLPLERWPSSV